MLEFVPIKNLAFVMSFESLVETAFALLAVIYVAFLSNNIIGYLFIGYAMQIVGTIAAFFIPESPKYLF